MVTEFRSDWKASLLRRARTLGRLDRASRVAASVVAGLALLLLPGTAQAQQPVHELCMPCHSETTTDFLNHPHAKNGLSCDTCHGESVAHRESGGGSDPDRVTAPDQTPVLCGTCHNQPIANSAGDAAPILAQYQGSKHGVFVAERSKVRAPHCATCHGAHGLRPARAIQLSCTRCHQELPQACSGEPPSQVSAVRCANCHQRHLFAIPR